MCRSWAERIGRIEVGDEREGIQISRLNVNGTKWEITEKGTHIIGTVQIIVKRTP